MILNIFFLVIVFVCVAMLWNEGLWNNGLTLLNVVLAGMVATNYFEPVAALADENVPKFTYFWDFLSLWALFWITFGVLRILASTVSLHKVKFRLPVDRFGGIIAALAVCWTLICFTCMTLHTAPLSLHSFRGDFQKEPGAASFLGFHPDQQWLGFVQGGSTGALTNAQSNKLLESIY